MTTTTKESPESILRDAFDKIQRNHGLVISRVDFEAVDLCLPGENRYIADGISITCTLIPGVEISAQEVAE